jgi:hypothetical protein
LSFVINAERRGRAVPSDYPYAIGTGKIPTLFQKVATTGIPPRVDNKWLEQYGMASSKVASLDFCKLGVVGP